jgi:N-acetylmuramoyl-L-alanine amidase
MTTPRARRARGSRRRAPAPAAAPRRAGARLRAGPVLALLAFAAAAAAIGVRFAPAQRRALPALAADARRGEEIVVAGSFYPIGARVVLWSDPGGYDAYARHRRDRPEEVLPERPAPGCDTPERIGKRRGVRTAEDLRAAITQFVIHYDESYTSRNCFHVLQDVRGLSVHFLLDLDGTIYQTCDLIERCRHASEANDRSVGVEIAHPGALEEDRSLAGRYKRDEAGRLYLELPRWLGKDPVLTRGFVPRPARDEPVRGTIQGHRRTQYDFTSEQYEALARLGGALARIFPALRLEAPRDGTGRVTDCVFASPEEAAAFHGVVGHYHLSKRKTDPGPAFDWERFLAGARRAAAGVAP